MSDYAIEVIWGQIIRERAGEEKRGGKIHRAYKSISRENKSSYANKGKY